MSGWTLGLCGCCGVKDCGPLCCINEYFCGACMWGAAMEQAGNGSCAVCCLSIACCTVCTLCKGGQDTASKYGIQEGCCPAFMKACCCPLCYSMQIQHEIMVKEKLHYGCMKFEKDAGAAPAGEEMER